MNICLLTALFLWEEWACLHVVTFHLVAATRGINFCQIGGDFHILPASAFTARPRGAIISRMSSDYLSPEYRVGKSANVEYWYGGFVWPEAVMQHLRKAWRASKRPPGLQDELIRVWRSEVNVTVTSRPPHSREISRSKLLEIRRKRPLDFGGFHTQELICLSWQFQDKIMR